MNQNYMAPSFLLRMFLMLISSVLMIMSGFLLPMAIVPIVLVLLQFPFAKGHYFVLISFALCSLLLLGNHYFLVGTYGAFCAIAAFIYESLRRDFHPVKTLMFLGMTLFIVTLLVLHFGGYSSVDFLTKQIKIMGEQFKAQKDILLGSQGTQGLEILSLFENPLALAQRIRMEFPGYLFVGCFFMAWINLYMSLKVRQYIVTQFGRYSDQELLHFRVYDFVIWIVIPLLGLHLGSEYLQISSYLWIINTLLLVIGVFYFFQGYGILVRLLNRFKIYGLFRTFLVVSLLTFAWWLVALMGLFDLWINFDRIIQKGE